MSKVLTFVRLDFITVKPYFTLKNLALMIAAPLIILITSNGSSNGAAFFMVFAALYISYPFVISEKNGLDALYTTLSVTRGTVVLGRYLFALLFDFCTALIGFFFTGASLIITQNLAKTPEMLITIGVSLAVITLLQAVQLPIYFKLGYEKAKFMAYLPFMGLMLLGFAANHFILQSDALPEQITGFFAWVAANPMLAIAIAVVIWLGAFLISYQTSVSYYSKRDF